MNSEHKRRHRVTMPRINTRKQSKKYHARTNPKFKDNKWQKYYGTKVWHQLRQTKLYEQPLCERCLAEGKVTPATSIHHVCVFGSCPTEEERWYWFLKYDNLISVCQHCHNEIHNKHLRGYIYYWPFSYEQYCQADNADKIVDNADKDSNDSLDNPSSLEDI